MTEQEQIASMREEIAEIRTEIRHIVKAIDKIGVAISAIARLEADNKALDDLKRDVAAMKDKLTWYSGAIAGLALFWPLIAKKLGIA